MNDKNEKQMTRKTAYLYWVVNWNTCSPMLNYFILCGTIGRSIYLIDISANLKPTLVIFTINQTEYLNRISFGWPVFIFLW